MPDRVVFFVDGENLVFRYQDMVADGRKPLHGVWHQPDVYVWHPDIIRNEPRLIHRVIYYTSAVGDKDKIKAIEGDIKRMGYRYQGDGIGCDSGIYHESHEGLVFPRVFWKHSQSHKTRSVDINITIDMLDYASLHNVDEVCLISGDGDFIPLIEAILRKGKRVSLKSLSKGLNEDLLCHVDKYTCLDDRLFERVLRDPSPKTQP